MHTARARRPGSSSRSCASRALKDAPAPLPAALTAGDFTHVTVTLGLTHDVCQATDTSHRRNTGGRSCRAGLKQPSRKAKAEPSQEPTFDAGCEPVPWAARRCARQHRVLLAPLCAPSSGQGEQCCRHGSGLTGPHLGWQVCILRGKREEEGGLTHQGFELRTLELPHSSTITSSKQTLSEGTKALTSTAPTSHKKCPPVRLFYISTLASHKRPRSQKHQTFLTVKSDSHDQRQNPVEEQ